MDNIFPTRSDAEKIISAPSFPALKTIRKAAEYVPSPEKD